MCSDANIARILQKISRRVIRKLCRLGYPETLGGETPEALPEPILSRLFMTASQSVYALYVEARGNPGG